MRVLVANRPSSPRPRLMQTTNSPTNEPRQVPTSPVPFRGFDSPTPDDNNDTVVAESNTDQIDAREIEVQDNVGRRIARAYVEPIFIPDTNYIDRVRIRFDELTWRNPSNPNEQGVETNLEIRISRLTYSSLRAENNLYYIRRRNRNYVFRMIPEPN